MSESVKWIELAKIVQSKVADRRAYEWKLAFGFWTAIGALTAARFTTDVQLPDHFPCALAVVYMILMGLSVYGWLIPLQTANAGDGAFLKHYLDKARGEGCHLEAPDANGKDPDVWMPRNRKWFIGQAGFTLVFLVLSWVVITQVDYSPSPDKPADAMQPAASPPVQSPPAGQGVAPP